LGPVGKRSRALAMRVNGVFAPADGQGPQMKWLEAWQAPKLRFNALAKTAAEAARVGDGRSLRG
jgi:hypothetical protein